MQYARPSQTESVSTDKALRAGVPFTPAVAPLVSRMELVDEYRQNLLRLQGAWEVLALLGQMSGIGAEIGQTRTSFQRLTETLLDSLACQLLEQRQHGLRGKAQVAIDILVRNLFERTADVGFLATDEVLCAFATAARDGASCDAQRAELQARFAAYVAKYSVYDDIVVLAPDGRVLARLDDGVTVERSHDPLVAAAQRSGMPFVESFGECDVLGGRRGLLYSAAIVGTDGRPAGVLCLSFRFENELGRIFARLLDGDDGAVIALLDAKGEVITSSDRWQLPAGAPLPAAASGQTLLRFAGREYLRVGAQSGGYQGYAGPGWHAQALLPVEFAFRVDTKAGAAATHEEHAALARGLDTRDIFSSELRGIPLRAQQIQRDLARSVWNGKLMRGNDGEGAAGVRSPEFATTFLHEVSNTGAQIRAVFEDAITRLQTGAITAILDQARFQASLAIDIMDRNLYERANDCRWWALTPVLRQALNEPDAALRKRAGEVLRHINSLYTVYTLLVLFDARGEIVGVSDPARNELIGQSLDAETVRATLALRDPQQYTVSEHAPSALYGGVPTYVYAAAVHPEGRGAAAASGGVAIVFDGAPQFAAMLRDALPRGADGEPMAGAFGLFVTRAGRVVASTDERFAPGSTAAFVKGLAEMPRGASRQQVVKIDGVLHAAGIVQSGGYREYRSGDKSSSQDVAAVVLMRLGEPLVQVDTATPLFEPLASPNGKSMSAMREIAGFAVDGNWYGLEAAEVEEVVGTVQIASIPNAPPQVSGLLKTRDRIVPVLDLAAMLQAGKRARSDGPLLLCRTGDGHRFVVRVDSLGTVFEIDSQRLKPWQPPGGAPAVRLLNGRMGTREAMLTVLSADALWQSLGGAALLELAPETGQVDAPASLIELTEEKQFA